MGPLLDRRVKIKILHEPLGTVYKAWSPCDQSSRGARPQRREGYYIIIRVVCAHFTFVHFFIIIEMYRVCARLYRILFDEWHRVSDVYYNNIQKLIFNACDYNYIYIFFQTRVVTKNVFSLPSTFPKINRRSLSW